MSSPSISRNTTRLPPIRSFSNIPPPLPSPPIVQPRNNFVPRKKFTSRPLPSRSTSLPSISRNTINLPSRSNTISSSYNSSLNLPNKISTTESSPEVENSQYSDGWSDELPGLIIICCILLFFVIILIWIMTEDRVLAAVEEEKKKKKKIIDPSKLKVKTVGEETAKKK